MGFFGNLLGNKTKNAEPEKVVFSPIKGIAVPLEEVGDPVFSEGMMGPGVGIEPEEGNLFSPVDGEITAAFPTGHALGIRTSYGLEILVHIGIDTVQLNGNGFHTHIKEGDQVKRGQLLVSFDIQKIQSAGYKTTTMVIAANASEIGSMAKPAAGTVNTGDRLFSIV